MPTCLTVSRPLIANTILFVDISKSASENIYIMNSKHIGVLGMIVFFVCLVCKGKIFLSLLMASAMGLHFSIQEEDTFEHTNAKCICVHFTQLADHYVTWTYTS